MSKQDAKAVESTVTKHPVWNENPSSWSGSSRVTDKRDLGVADLAQKEDYRVNDIKDAMFGRKEIELAEVEMPGLMACREEMGPKQPLKGARISGSLHMTIQTAVLIETLKYLGAQVRWSSCNIYSTQDHAAAAIADAKSAAVFAWPGESLAEYWWCTYQMISWPDSREGPDLIVDDGGDATLLIHEGVKFEKIYAEKKTLPDPQTVNDKELKIVYELLAHTIKEKPDRWTKMAKHLVGVSEETTTGVHRLKQMAEKHSLLFPAINVNDSVTKSKFDNIYGCRHSLPDGIMRATDVMIAGKISFVAGYGDVGKGCAQALKAAGSRVLVGEIDPICALQATMEGFQVVPLEDIIGQVDIVVTATGNAKIVSAHHMSMMKNNAIVCNIGHFDTEIDMEGLEKYEGIKKTNIKPQCDRWVFPETKQSPSHGILVLAEGRLVNLGCATGHPSFVMSCSFTNQVVAQVDLWTQRKTEKYSKQPFNLYKLPKVLDEKVARLHLDKLGAKLTVLTDEQVKYSGLPKAGPYKDDSYRY